MTKKLLLAIVSLCLVVCLVLSFGACKKKNKDNSSTSTVEEESIGSSDSGSGNSSGDNETVELTPAQQKEKIAESVTNFTLAEVLQSVSLPEGYGEELSNAVDEINSFISNVFTYGKKYTVEVSHKESDEKEHKDSAVSLALGNGQVALNTSNYHVDNDEESEFYGSDVEEEGVNYYLVNKDGDIYVVPGGEAEYALYALNIAETVNMVKGFLSGETKVDLESVLGMLPEEVAGTAAPVLGFVKSYQFPALTVSDFVEAEGFYCVSNDYLIKVVEDVMVKGSAAMGEEISDDDVQEKMEIVKNVIVNLNIKLGFKADAYGVNALLLEVKPSHEFLVGMQAPVQDVEVRFELNGLRAFESCTAKAAFTPVNWDEDENGKPVAVELGSFTANFSADKNGAHAVVDVAVNMGETPITINGALDYVAGSKCELNVSVVGSGLTYVFNEEAERDQINIYVRFEKKTGGFSLDAAVGIEDYGELIKANAHFYDGAAGEKDFGVTLYVDPTISKILKIPAIDVKVVGTYKEGKITFKESHIYMPEYDYEYSVWVNADNYKVDAKVNYTVCIDFKGDIDLHDFLNAKVGADFTLTRTYKDITVEGYYYVNYDEESDIWDGEEPLTEDMIDVIKDKYNYDAQRMWIHTENIAGGSKIIAEMQLLMREGEHAGEFDTGAIGYVKFTVTDATAEDFLSDDAVAALEHEEGAPTIIDMLLAEIFGGHGSVEPDYPE